MSLPTLGTFTSLPVAENRTLVAPPVAEAISAWEHAGEVAVVEIDPELADTAAFCAAYQVPVLAGANCVVVGGARAGEDRVAACVVRADTRADVNGAVRRLLDVRRASFLKMEEAVAETGMEYGGITPLGLPHYWRVLVDSRCLDIDVAVLGSGFRNSKLLIRGGFLADLPGAEVLVDLAKSTPVDVT